MPCTKGNKVLLHDRPFLHNIANKMRANIETFAAVEKCIIHNKWDNYRCFRRTKNKVPVHLSPVLR